MEQTIAPQLCTMYPFTQDGYAPRSVVGAGDARCWMHVANLVRFVKWKDDRFNLTRLDRMNDELLPPLRALIILGMI